MEHNSTPYSGNFKYDNNESSGDLFKNFKEVFHYLDDHQKQVNSRALKNVVNFASAYFVCQSQTIKEIEINLN